MAYNVTEMWSSRSDETSYTGMTSARYFSVTGTLPEMADAKNVERAPGIPRLGQSHQKDRSLKVASVQAGPGLTERIVTASYQWFPNGFPNGGTPSPLSTIPIIQWSRASRSVSQTHDIYGSPIANSAGKLFDPAYQRDMNSYIVEILKYEAKFDFTKAARFEGRVSSTEMVSGGVKFPAGTIKCLSIMPAEPFASNASIVRMSYQLEIRIPRGTPRTKPTLIELHPFRHWLADQGTSVAAGPLYNIVGTATVGDPVTEPVLLSHGAPVESGLYLLAPNGTGAAGTSPASNDKLPKNVLRTKIAGVDWLGYAVDPSGDLLELRL
jgi:hypothetical protein